MSCAAVHEIKADAPVDVATGGHCRGQVRSASAGNAFENSGNKVEQRNRATDKGGWDASGEGSPYLWTHGQAGRAFIKGRPGEGAQRHHQLFSGLHSPPATGWECANSRDRAPAPSTV